MSCEYCGDSSSSLDLDQGELMRLATAIAVGKRPAAREALDMLVRDDERAREWIARARALATEDPVERIAAEMAETDGLNWHRRCPHEDDGGSGSCDSPTCIAAFYDDHDPDVARASYRRYAMVALGLPVKARRQASSQDELGETAHV